MGYVGIHLSLIIDGFNGEIQISTREAWYAKQAGEEIYERWRNFNLAKEVSNIVTINNNDEKKEKIKQLFSQYHLRSIQKNYCKNLFSSLHKHTKLDKLKESINAVLYLNTYNYKENENKNLKKYNIKIKDIKNEEELLDNCKHYLSIIKETSYNEESKLTSTEKDFIVLKRKYFSLIVEEMKKDLTEILRFLNILLN